MNKKFIFNLYGHIHEVESDLPLDVFPIRVRNVLLYHKILTLADLSNAVLTKMLSPKNREIRNYGKWAHERVLKFLEDKKEFNDHLQCPRCKLYIKNNE